MGAPVTFKSSDLARAVQTIKACGLTVGAAEITREGTIRVLTSEALVLPALTPPAAGSDGDALSPLERWERSRGHGPA